MTYACGACLIFELFDSMLVIPGLSIAKRRAEIFGGAIGVSKEVEVGSTFLWACRW
jgi:hypothetical protein